MKLSFTKISKAIPLFIFTFLSISIYAQVPANNECSGAEDISALFGQPVGMTMSSGLFDNTNATSEASDPTTGFDCFGEPNYSTAVPLVENSLWFSFVGDGNTYFIESDDCGSANYLAGGDTQFAVYTGGGTNSCNSLMDFGCVEDGPNAVDMDFKAGITIETLQDTTYYILVDGFNFQGSLSSGEYCMQVTQIANTTCTDISVGTVTAARQVVCFGDTTEFTIEEVVIPNSEPGISGFRWIISGADVSGSADPGADPTYAGAFGQSAAAYTPTLVNNGMTLNSNVLVYFTPVTYAGAVDTGAMPGFFEGLDFSNGCLETGNSILVLLAGDNGPITTTPYTSAATSNNPFNGEAGVDIGGGSFIYDVLWDNGATTDTITGLSPGDYMVTISDPGNCVASTTLTITVADSTTTSTFSPEFEAALQLYPNPAKDFTHLDFNFNENTDLNIQLLNVQGQTVLDDQIRDASNGRYKINTSQFPPGIYLIRIQDQDNLLTKRLFIE